LKKKILFRVDHNDKIGLGHFIRCINLATLFVKNKHKVTIIAKKNKKINFNKTKKIKLIYLKDNISAKYESNFVMNYFLKNKFDYFFLDVEHNLLNTARYQIFLNGIYSILKKTICWDNIATNRYKFGLTYRPYPNFINLKKLNKSNKILSGIDKMYFPHIQKKKNHEIKNILINLGGTNQTKKIKKILLLIDSINLNKKLNVYVLGANFKTIKKKLKNHKYFFSNFKKPKKLYNNIDLAIASGGMAKYECIMNYIPSIIINLTNQQKKINFKLKDERYVLLLNNLDNFKQKFKLIISNKSLRIKIIKNCKKIRKDYSEKKIVKKLLF